MATSSKTIIGPRFLERLRESDYKNSVYAIAEIVDNSVDADATKIEIIIVSDSDSITDIYFTDNGSGMTLRQLEDCVVFSEGGNTAGGTKSGYFGMGLPNSSLSQCRDLSVYTSIENEWYRQRLDFNDMISRGILTANVASKANVAEVNKILKKSNIENVKTVIHWSHFDNLDSDNPKTIIRRVSRLLGRIHRYSIQNGVSMSILDYRDNNVTSTTHPILVNDPMYLSKGELWVTSKVKSSLNFHRSADERMDTRTYFSKYLYCENGTQLSHPLFYELDDACNNVSINYKGVEYTIELTVSVAYPNIQKPGIRNGGQTDVGKEFNVKVKGAQNYPSGNISWVRNNREITTANHSLFNISDETARFWSIELKYSTGNTKDGLDYNVLDKLLGLSNTKQGFKFSPSEDGDIYPPNSSLNKKKEELTRSITLALNTAIDKAKKKLKKQASDFHSKLKGWNNEGDHDGGTVMPGPNPVTFDVLLNALGKGEEYNTQEIDQLTSKIKGYLSHLDKKDIKRGVEQYSKIGIKSIIIYCELDDRDIFQSDSYAGRNITLINTNHSFFSRVIEPLQESGKDDVLASIELLLSALSSAMTDQPSNQKEANQELMTSCAKNVKNLLVRHTLPADDI